MKFEQALTALTLVAILSSGCASTRAPLVTSREELQGPVVFTRDDILSYIHRWRNMSDDESAAWHISDYFCLAAMVRPVEFFDVMSTNRDVFDSWHVQLQVNSFTQLPGDCMNRRCLLMSFREFVRTVSVLTELDLARYGHLVKDLQQELETIEVEEVQ